MALVTWPTQFPVPSAYGGMSLQTPFAGSDITGAYQIIEFDTATPTRLITLDLVANTFAINSPGVYQIIATLTFEHNSDNSSRQTNVRFWNVTESAAAFTKPLGAGRNVEVSRFTHATLWTVGDFELNDTIRLEIGGGSTFSSINWASTSLAISRVGSL